jgi:hypothetical protein
VIGCEVPSGILSLSILRHRYRSQLLHHVQAVGDAARAARLFGAAEMLLQSLDAALEPSGSLEYDSNLADTRTRLGEEAFAKAWQEGMTMPLEQAVTEAMSKGL